MDAPSARIPLFVVLAALLLAVPGCGEPEPVSLAVEVGRSVALDYTLTLEDGTPVGENAGDEPMRFRVGADQITPGLERELIGLRVGDRRRVVVDPEDGYGPVREEGFQEIDIARIPEEFRVVGAQMTPGTTRETRTRCVCTRCATKRSCWTATTPLPARP